MHQKSIYTKKKFWKNQPRGKKSKNYFSKIIFFLKKHGFLRKKSKFYFFQNWDFRFFSSRLVFPKKNFSMPIFNIQKILFVKIPRNRGLKNRIVVKKSILRAIQRQKMKIFRFFSSRLVKLKFFFGFSENWWNFFFGKSVLTPPPPLKCF